MIPTIVDKNNVTTDKVYWKVAILMYTEMFNFRPQSRKTLVATKTIPFFVAATLTFVHDCLIENNYVNF